MIPASFAANQRSIHLCTAQTPGRKHHGHGLVVKGGVTLEKYKYSKTSQTDCLYRSTPSLYQPAFHITEIKSCGKFYKSTTSLNGPHEFTTVSGRFREVLLYTKTSQTGHLYRSTPSLYRPVFHINEIKSTVFFCIFGSSV